MRGDGAEVRGDGAEVRGDGAEVMYLNYVFDFFH